MTTDPKRRPFALIEQPRHGIGPAEIKHALSDIRDGWRRYQLWGTLGLHDVRQRYRRSTLGPFWITLSMGVMVLALGLLYGQIFGLDLHAYLPFISAGFVIWALVSGLLLGGCQAFISSEGMIRQLNAPLSIYAYREVWSGLIGFLHNIWIFVIVAWWYDLAPGWTALLALPALLILLINGLWMSLLLGLVSARFRDVPLIVASVTQVLFFLTPIIWLPEMVPNRALFLQMNPFYHMVEVLRAPLLGQWPSFANWAAVILIALFGWGVTILVYTAYRWRIAYWV